MQETCECADYVSHWASTNQLELNLFKTELIWFPNGRKHHRLVGNDILLFGNLNTPVHNVRNLGVIRESHMTLSQLVWPELSSPTLADSSNGRALSAEYKLVLAHVLVWSGACNCRIFVFLLT